MRQKTILRVFLIFGISLIILSFIRCHKDDVNSIKTVTYIYKNTSGVDLNLEVYNPSKQKIKEYSIPNGSQIISHTTESEGIGIFQYAENENMLGDSIIVIFEGNKCIRYKRSIPNKIFDVKRYDNYTDDLIKQKEFSLIYTISVADYDSAGTCR